MSASDDYCELCDLPRSQCIHGMPAPAAAPEPAKAAPRPRQRATPSASAATTSTRPVARRWTPPEELSPLIVDVLREAGGELPTDEALEALRASIGDRMRPGDEEKTPGGELRWHYAARRARQALLAEGLMVAGTQGMWTLAERP